MSAFSTQSKSTSSDRVRRPLGLTLAILSIGVLFGLAPLLEVYFLHRIDATTDDELFLLGGVDMSLWFWLEAGWGVVILILCVFAWWGRPARIRFILVAAILIPTAVNLFRVIEAVNSPNNPVFGGQVQSTMRSYLICQLPLLFVVPLYSVWYLNRAPARAFYRRVPLSSLGWSADTNPDQSGSSAADPQPENGPPDR